MREPDTNQESKSDRKIKQGFLRVLAHKHFDDMTIVEVVKEAHVSRSTFYLRFENLSNVYDALVADMLGNATPIDMQVDCAECKSIASQHSAKPFCELVRGSSEYAPLVKEDRFLASVIQLMDAAKDGSMVREGLERGLTHQQAYALHVFQMSGCFAASVMTDTDDAEWPKVKEAIDTFISGGISSLR